MGYGPQSHRELNTAEHTHSHTPPSEGQGGMGFRSESVPVSGGTLCVAPTSLGFLPSPLSHDFFTLSPGATDSSHLIGLFGKLQFFDTCKAFTMLAAMSEQSGWLCSEGSFVCLNVLLSPS